MDWRLSVRSVIRQEIEDGHSFVCMDGQGEILGTFCFILGEDPNYQHIYEGNWLNDEPYGVIHRLATNGKRKGVSDACLNWCFEQWGNIRVDTHQDNKVMQHILTKYGFQRCGIIYVKNGTERIASVFKAGNWSFSIGKLEFLRMETKVSKR